MFCSKKFANIARIEKYWEITLKIIILTFATLAFFINPAHAKDAISLSQQCQDQTINQYNLWLNKYKDNYFSPESVANLKKVPHVKNCPETNKRLAKISITQQLRGINRNATIKKYVQAKVDEFIIANKPPTFSRDVPEKSEYKPLPKLVKDEFESTAQFKARIKKAEQQYVEHVEDIDNQYTQDIDNYNESVKAFNNRLNRHNQFISAKLLEVRKKSMAEAFTISYGKPKLKKDSYDADSEIFYLTLLSENGRFKEKLSMPMPRARAKSFNDEIAQMEPKISLKIANNAMKVSTVDVVYRGQNYQGKVAKQSYQNIPVVVALNQTLRNSSNTQQLSTIRPEKSNTSKRLREIKGYTKLALQLENDPEIARLRQQRAEQQRISREIALKKARDQEILALKKQTAQLEASNQGQQVGADKTLAREIAKFKAKPIDNDKYLLAIGIEKYQGTAPVPYAKNSVHMIAQALAKTKGIAKENTTVLTDATGTRIKGELKKILNKIKTLSAGKASLYLYYAGHSVRGRNQKNAYILPADAVAGAYEDDDFALQNIINSVSLARLNKANLIIDSCFSGKKSKDEMLFKGVGSASLGKEKVSRPVNINVFYAGEADQFANEYQDKGHRLFSYFYAKGLLKNLEARELEQYVQRNVRRVSVNRGPDYEQTPYFQ